MVEYVIHVLETKSPKGEVLARQKDGNFERVEAAWAGSTGDWRKELWCPFPDRHVLHKLGVDLVKLAPHGLLDDIEGMPSGTRARITVRLPAGESVGSRLPWELLRKPDSLNVAARSDCSLRYQQLGSATCKPEPIVGQKGRILFSYSTGGGNVPFEAHLNAIEGATRDRMAFFSSDDMLANQTFESLISRLEQARKEHRGPFSILHVLCHGGRVRSDTECCGLMWLDGRGKPIPIDPAIVANMLRPFAPTLRLVILSVCSSGNAGQPDNLMGSVAQQIHSAGVESVIASRLPLSVEGSKILARELFDALVVHSSTVEYAVSVARRELWNQLGTKNFDYASIMLWGRDEDGWDVRPVPAWPDIDPERVEILRIFAILADVPIPLAWFSGEKELVRVVDEHVERGFLEKNGARVTMTQHQKAVVLRRLLPMHVSSVISRTVALLMRVLEDMKVRANMEPMVLGQHALADMEPMALGQHALEIARRARENGLDAERDAALRLTYKAARMLDASSEGRLHAISLLEMALEQASMIPTRDRRRGDIAYHLAVCHWNAGWVDAVEPLLDDAERLARITLTKERENRHWRLAHIYYHRALLFEARGDGAGVKSSVERSEHRFERWLRRVTSRAESGSLHGIEKQTKAMEDKLAEMKCIITRCR